MILAKNDRKISRKEREREFRKQAILEVAKDVFKREGYSNAGMAQIASEAELSVGTLYQSFPNKVTLFAEVVLQHLDEGRHELERIIQKKKSREDKLQTFLELYLSWASDEKPDYMKTIIDLYYSPDPDIAPDVQLKFRALESSATAIVRDILTQSEDLNPDIDPNFTAIVLTGVLNSIYRSCSIGLLEKDPVEYIPDIRKILFK